MISKNKIKELSALSQKKVRDEKQVFIAEGSKIVSELIQIFPCRCLVALTEWIQEYQPTADEILKVTEKELERISLQKAPQKVFAVFEKPSRSTIELPQKNELCLALDEIQDPGNMGTILRIADWFGIEKIYCSSSCADVYGPKTIQSTMGAIGRVKTFQNVDLVDFLTQCKRKKISIYGTFLEGDVIYNKTLNMGGIIVIGNEGNGISKEVETVVTDKLFIPSYPAERSTSESLNAAVATAVVCAEFRRQNL